MADVRQRRGVEEPSCASDDADEPRRKGHLPPSTFRVSAAVVPLAYAGATFLGFLGALLDVMLTEKYFRVVKNEHFGYPDEWFPSISATIGDWYPSRNIFQIACAIASGPRFAILLFAHVLMKPPAHTGRSNVVVLVLDALGLLRTLAAGTWIYITSTDDHFVHDVGMIAYLALTLLYMIGMVVESSRIARTWDPAPDRKTCTKWRARFLLAFVASIPPLVWLFIRHKVHRLPGAYSYYAYCEWSLILIDVGFDAVSYFDFRKVELVMLTLSPSSASQTFVPDKRTAASKTPNGRYRSGVDVDTAVASSVTRIAADVYLAYVFWTTWTSLPAVVWYFPLWSMGISGQEVSVLLYNTAFLLTIPPVRKLVQQNLGVASLLSLIGIGCYWVPKPEWRLVYTGLGVGAVTLVWFAYFLEANRRGSRWEYLAWMLGLVLANVVKFANRSLNPAWTIMNSETGGWNKTAIALGVLASVEMIRRTRSPATWKRDPKKTDGYGSSDGDDVPTEERSHWLLAGLGLGGVLFSLLAMATDSATIVRWATEGYPHTGPGPIIGGLISMAAMVLGLWIGTDPVWRSGILSDKAWWGATAGIFILYFWHRWLGFLAGMFYLTFLFAVAPPILEAAVSQRHIGRTFFIGTLLLNVLIVLAQWPVAYEFVPGGWLLRERTWVIVLCQQLLLWCGTRAARNMWTEPPSSVRSSSTGETGTRTMLRTSLAAIGTLLAVSTVWRVATMKAVHPINPAERIITGGIWTIHFGIDDDGYSSHKRMEALIRDLDVDVFGMLESDLQRIIMGNRDISQYLAEKLGFYTDYGPSPIKHTWGCTLLSRFPILRSEHHLLPSPVGELACAIHATLDVYGREVDVIVSHNGQEENLRDRQLQTDKLATIASTNDGRPIIFLGYVVTAPGVDNDIYRRLIVGGNLTDADPTDWDRWCEYVAYRGLYRIGYARVSHGGITDTEVQLGRFIVPAADVPSGAWQSTRRTMEEKIPQTWRFPDVFKGDGIRGHRYHVFDEARYWTMRDGDVDGERFPDVQSIAEQFLKLANLTFNL